MTDQNFIDVLKFVQTKDMISIDNEQDLADLVDKMNKRTVIENHPYAITETVKHGKPFYITYVYDETKAKNRRQISATSKENIENKIYKEYKQKHINTFDHVFREWFTTSYRNKVKESTYARTKTDYDRFFKGTDFSMKSIATIKPIDVEDFIHNTIVDKNLGMQAYKNLKSLLNGIFKYALRKEYIHKNIMELVEISTSNIKRSKKKSKEEVVFTLQEMKLIKKTISEDISNYKTSVPFAILLSFQLGLRVGELIALQWSDIDFKAETIHIQRQEICYTNYDKDLNTIGTVHKIVNYVKTEESDRILRLTPEALKILDQVKFWNKEKNLNGLFIFLDNDNKHFNRQRINTSLYSYCNKINTIKKSSHKIRRSVISNLLDHVDNKESVRMFAGHADLQTTYNSYYKDISDDDTFYNGMCACL